MKRVDVAIIGAGTAGLSARREVARYTDSYVVIDDGVLGTTCARVGCMPSKVLIQVADDFHRRHVFGHAGIRGAEGLAIDQPAVMQHVRALRDRFVRSVLGSMRDWEAKLVRKRARFFDLHTLDLGDEKIRADRVIIATGSTPIVPRSWEPHRARLIDTDAFFELETLPRRLAVVGLGVIGLELGQALHRLGVQVTGITLDKSFGGLSDPELQQYVYEAVGAEMPIHIGAVTGLSEDDSDLVLDLEGAAPLRVDAALVAMGRRPNVASLGIEEVGIETERGIPRFDPTTFRVAGTDWYIAGDVNGTRPLLHEASDEGRIAGYNATREADQCFARRTPLTITFSHPPIAIVGESLRQLEERDADFVTGSVSYEGQGRAIVKLSECGLLHVYADRASGRLLGAELFAPSGDHLAHLLAWAVTAELTVQQTLSLPFYHPALEEGVRTALRAAARRVEGERAPLEVLRCQDPPVGIQA
ncbi:MAG: dihydrolipoyl dehydrogenase [Sandaracinaceae bacterium]|nr:dihydrolipoyl dehydrogenase [Sandaracinaceae bacterium]